MRSKKRGSRKTVGRARQVLEKQGYAFVDGSKHNFLFELACICNRWGIPKSEVYEYVGENLIEVSEIESNCIDGPYEKYREQFGTRV
jgi:hypothetical protein